MRARLKAGYRSGLISVSIIILSVFFSAPVVASGSTDGLLLPSRSDISYSFDGIEGDLSLEAYFDNEDWQQSVSIQMSCSKERAAASVQFSKLAPIIKGVDGQLVDISINGETFQANRFNIAGMETFGSFLNEDISRIVKALHKQVSNGNGFLYVRQTNGDEIFKVFFSGPYIEDAHLAVEEFRKEISREEARKRVGRFHQLCSIWWGS